ncbi:MAG: RNA 2'-phosphotransferase [Candidatus Bipolaricaulota bacterium]|nr:RNA 2'-phosphotransferase [Candidatus Bipolaricaulota bacterium]MBS3791704.1 RNA 2'-phosphotransferase [Candidatus Bipolaricaulota bacterium]
MNRREVSKQMAYLLRHDPSGMSMDEEGFIDLEDLLNKLRERWKNLTEPELRGIVEEDPKGRYEISDGRIRALYGHSVNVDPDLPEVEVEVLYHGTSPKAAERIDREGLRSQGRRKVHLSARKEDAIKVGKRHTPEPVLLEIEADEASESGVTFQRASDKVYVSDFVPSKFIEHIEH